MFLFSVQIYYNLSKIKKKLAVGELTSPQVDQSLHLD